METVAQDVHNLVRAIFDDELQRVHLKILALSAADQGRVKGREGWAELCDVSAKTISNSASELRLRGYLKSLPKAMCEAASVESLVWAKTDGLCAYCACRLDPFNRKAHNGFQIDHVVPREQGGSDDLDNLAPACKTCNGAKGPRTPGEWKNAGDAHVS